METTQSSSNKKIQLICIALIFFGIIALISIKLLDRTQDTNRASKPQSEQLEQPLANNIDDIVTEAGVASKLEIGAIAENIEDTETKVTVEIETETSTKTDLVNANSDVANNEDSVDDKEENEYANLAIANVDHYVNVRNEPNTNSGIVGKMYDGSVAQILSTAGENDEWFKVISGNVEGYIKSEYFIYGDDAADVIDEYVTRYAVVQADRLNVRKEPDISSNRIGYIDNGEKAKLLEFGDEWSKVNYMGDKEGFVATEYVTIAEEFVYAKSIEEEKAELAALREQQERAKASEAKAPERPVISAAPPQTNYANVSELRSAVVNYAMQYLGNRYVHGGQSLESGTDCSGFTCYVYAAFGYGLSRTPQGQYTSAGRSISMEEIQPGDIICYSSNGSTCTHVGLYIGNGQIIHAANSRKGVIISNYNYSGTILGIRSIVD